MEPHTYLTIETERGVLRFAQEPMRNIKVSTDGLDEGGGVVSLGNGRAYSLARTAFRKRVITVSGTTDVPPPMSDWWIGMTLKVGSPDHEELQGDFAPADLAARAVPGSLKWFRLDADGFRWVEAAHGDAGVAMTRYHPLHHIALTETPTRSKDEWTGRVDWKFTGREI